MTIRTKIISICQVICALLWRRNTLFLYFLKCPFEESFGENQTNNEAKLNLNYNTSCVYIDNNNQIKTATRIAKAWGNHKIPIQFGQLGKKLIPSEREVVDVGG